MNKQPWLVFLSSFTFNKKSMNLLNYKGTINVNDLQQLFRLYWPPQECNSVTSIMPMSCLFLHDRKWWSELCVLNMINSYERNTKQRCMYLYGSLEIYLSSVGKKIVNQKPTLADKNNVTFFFHHVVFGNSFFKANHIQERFKIDDL